MCAILCLRPGADQSSKAAFGKSAFAKSCFLLLKIRQLNEVLLKILFSDNGHLLDSYRIEREKFYNKPTDGHCLRIKFSITPR